MRVIMTVLVLVACVCVPASAQSGAYDPLKVAVEAQAWWVPNFGHIHLAVKAPIGRVVSGTMELDARFLLHDNPAALRVLTVDPDVGGLVAEPAVNRFQSNGYNDYCPYNGTVSNTCAWDTPVLVDTTRWKDGWRQVMVRLTARGPDGGLDFVAEVQFLIYSQNGNILKDAAFYEGDGRKVEIRGYYGGQFIYQMAAIQAIPTTPVSGPMTLWVRATQPNNQRMIIELDKTHAHPAVGTWPAEEMSVGEVLLDVSGGANNVWRPIVIDTTPLAPGWHWLAIRHQRLSGATSTCAFCLGEENIASGVLKFWFHVGPSAQPLPPESEDLAAAILRAETAEARAASLATQLAAAQAKIDQAVTVLVGP